MNEFFLQLDWYLFFLGNSILTHPILDKIFPIITNFHQKNIYTQLIIIISIIVWLIFSKKRGLKIFFIISVLLLMVDSFSYYVLKKNINRTRPCNVINPPFKVNTLVYKPTSNSFPSNHASNMFALSFAFSFFYPQLRILFYIGAVLVAYSRIYVGVHFFSDVISGAIIGTLIAFLFLKGMFYYKYKFYEFFKRNP